MTIKDYLAKIGRRGGKAKSAAKTAACRRNARKPRVRKTTDSQPVK